MADAKDVRALRVARTELARRGIDIGRADIRVSHGILYIKGTIGATKGCTASDLKLEVEHIGRILRSKSEFKDVVVDCMFR